MESLIRYFAGEGRVIRRVPATFSLGIALSAAIIWAVLNWQYSEQITNLNSRISLRDDQIADYKTKLGAAIPGEAKTRAEPPTPDSFAPSRARLRSGTEPAKVDAK
jgi:hypothetical protein